MVALFSGLTDWNFGWVSWHKLSCKVTLTSSFFCYIIQKWCSIIKMEWLSGRLACEEGKVTLTCLWHCSLVHWEVSSKFSKWNVLRPLDKEFKKSVKIVIVRKLTSLKVTSITAVWFKLSLKVFSMLWVAYQICMCCSEGLVSWLV